MHRYAARPAIGAPRLVCRCRCCRRAPLLPRALRAAALFITAAAACVGLLALGAWLDA